MSYAECHSAISSYTCCIGAYVGCSNYAAVSDRSTVAQNCLQYSLRALPHMRRFRIPGSRVSQSRDPDVATASTRHANPLFPHATHYDY